MTKDLILGLDFGSSTTIAGVLIDDRIQLVQEYGDPVIPSVVYVPDRGSPEIGRRAVHRQRSKPMRVVRSIKRVLGLAVDSDLARHYAAIAPFHVDRVGGSSTSRS